MALYYSRGTAGGDISDIGFPYAVAVAVDFPALLEFALVMAHPVLVIGNVAADAVVEFAYAVFPAELSLETAVGHGSDVLSRCTGITHYHIHGWSIENSVGNLVVVIDRTCEPVVKNTEIHTEVSNGSRLPSKRVVLDGSN